MCHCTLWADKTVEALCTLMKKGILGKSYFKMCKKYLSG